MEELLDCLKVLRRLPQGEFQAVTAGDGTRCLHFSMRFRLNIVQLTTALKI